MNNYEINEDTLAIVNDNNGMAKVYENDKEFYVNCSVKKIMEQSCEYFGSSFEGRKKATEKLIGVSYKPPIIVEESNEIIFFPTSSLRDVNNCWISLGHIKDYKQKNNTLQVNFKNGKSIKVFVSYVNIDRQILRATRLESTIRSRKKRINSSSCIEEDILKEISKC